MESKRKKRANKDLMITMRTVNKNRIKIRLNIKKKW